MACLTSNAVIATMRGAEARFTLHLSSISQPRRLHMTFAAAHLEIPADGQQATLAMRASLAAIALDRRLRDEKAPLTHVTKLVEALKNTIEPLPGSVAPANLLDPVAAELLNRALANAKAATALTSLPEVSAHVRDFIARLEHVEAITTLDEIRVLRDFCLALSQSAQLEMPAAFGGIRLPDLG
jgi:hypothetical protein